MYTAILTVLSIIITIAHFNTITLILHLHVFNITCNGLRASDALNTFAPSRRRKPSIVDESNHDGAEQETFLEQ